MATLDQNPANLTLLKLSEPLLTPHSDNQQHRTSDASATSPLQTPTPNTLTNDLQHYRSLFTKLRFSYTEQVTKEKFLRYLVSSTPVEHVSPTANAELERQLGEVKETLRAQKRAVDEEVNTIEVHARELARRWKGIESAREELDSLPSVIEGLKAEVEEMRRTQGIDGEVGDGQAEMGMGLEETVTLVKEREQQLERVGGRLEEVREEREKKEKELEKLQEDVVRSEREVKRAKKAAEDARRRREGKGGVGDEIEEKGRWLRGVEGTLRGLL